MPLGAIRQLIYPGAPSGLIAFFVKGLQGTPTQTNATVRVVDLISEGPIEGLIDGAASIRVDGVPLFDAAGASNIEGVRGRMWYGGPALWPGVTDLLDIVERDVAVNRDVLTGAPVSQVIVNPEVDAVRYTLRFPRLAVSDNRGNVHPLNVFIDFLFRSGALPEYGQRVEVHAKFTSPAELSWEFDLKSLGPPPYTIRVRRPEQTPEDNDRRHSRFQWTRYTELIRTRLTYPHSAIARITAEADRYHGQLRKREYDVKGLIVRVPTNYTPATRAYAGVWDGTFKDEWTDNGAWIAYHLLANKRYGLGNDITAAQLSAAKWELYAIAKFNDELVRDGKGDWEPRFRIAGVINKASDAKRVIGHLLGAFHSGIFYGAGGIYPVQDRPAAPSLLVSNSNVIDGKFEYAGLPHSQRFSAVAMSFNDPAEGYKLGIELVVDDALVEKYGYRKADKAAMFCTSRSQAQRMARYFLHAQENESDTMSYRAGLDHAMLRPGAIIKQTDTATARGNRLGFRIKTMLDENARATEGVFAGGLFQRSNQPLDLHLTSIPTGQPRRLNLAETPWPAEPDTALRMNAMRFCALHPSTPVSVLLFEASNPRQHLTAGEAQHYALVVRFKRIGDGTHPNRNWGDSTPPFDSDAPLAFVAAAYLPLADARPGNYRYNWDESWYTALDPAQNWVDKICHTYADYDAGATGANRISIAILRIDNLDYGPIPLSLMMTAEPNRVIEADSLAAVPAVANDTDMRVSAMLPSGNIETRDVQILDRAAGRILLTEPFSAAPLPGAMAAIEHDTAHARLWRVLSVSETDALEYQVKCRAHDPNKYAIVEGQTFLVDTPGVETPASPPPAPSAVAIEEEIHLDGRFYKSRLNIGITDADPDHLTDLVEVQIRETSQAPNIWLPVAVQAARTAAWEDVALGHEYQARARIIDAATGTRMSPWTESPLLTSRGKTTAPDYSTDDSVEITHRFLPTGEREISISSPADPAFAGWIFYERTPTPHEGEMWIERGRSADGRFKIPPRYWDTAVPPRRDDAPGFNPDTLYESGFRLQRVGYDDRVVNGVNDEYAFRGFDTSNPRGIAHIGSGLSPTFKRYFPPPVQARRNSAPRPFWQDGRLFLNLARTQGEQVDPLSFPHLRWVIFGVDGTTPSLSTPVEPLLVDGLPVAVEVPKPYKAYYVAYRQNAADIEAGALFQKATLIVPQLAPLAPEVITDVVDNAVMFDYRATARTAPIRKFELRKGADFAAAEIIATQAGQSSHMVLVEKVGGQFVYWWTAEDANGLTSAPTRVSADVKFNADMLAHFSSFGGGWRGEKTRILEAEGRLFMPVQAQTWAEHFSAARPNMQTYIDHGFRYYAQPTGPHGGPAARYREAFDYGSVINDAVVQVRPYIIHLGGYPPNAQGQRQQPTIKVEHSLDASTWTDAGFADRGIISNFRHIRVDLTMPRANEKSLAELDELLISVIRPTFTTLTGTGTATASGDGVWVTLTPPQGHIILSSEPPVILPFGDGALTGASDQDERVSRPTGFRVKLYSAAGARAAGKFRWQALCTLHNDS